MNKTIFLFPGQGSQSVGMGLQLYQEFSFVRELFEMAEEVTKKHLGRMCFEGPADKLTETVNLQPAITAVNLACLAAVKSEGVKTDFSAGHSLGEYSALNSAGVLSDENTIRLVNRRGELMHDASLKNKGSMAAVIGLDIETVKKMTEAFNATKGAENAGVFVANHNAENQIVVSGDADSVKGFCGKVKAEKGRAIMLKVSGAWHSALMKNAEKPFSDYINAIDMKEPDHKVIFNFTGDFADKISDIKTNLVQQICSPVQWYDTMVKCIGNGVNTFVEIGPGKVLTGLVKKIVPADLECVFFTINDMKSLESFFKNRK